MVGGGEGTLHRKQQHESPLRRRFPNPKPNSRVQAIYYIKFYLSDVHILWCPAKIWLISHFMIEERESVKMVSECTYVIIAELQKLLLVN